MLGRSVHRYTDGSTITKVTQTMDIDALSSFELTFEGYCQAITAYALTANPHIIKWLAVVDSMVESGELVWEPARTLQERNNRVREIKNAAIAIGLLSKQRI